MNRVFSQEQLGEMAASLWNEGKQKNIWAFHAPMGAGKTTLIRKIGDHLGVITPISSPTFSLINEYVSSKIGTIYHMDWYRLKDEAEALRAGVEDCLLSNCLCLIEWPSNAAGLLPDDTFHIHLQTIDPNHRRIIT